MTKQFELIEKFGADSDIATVYSFFLEKGVELKHMTMRTVRGEKFAHQLLSDPDNFTLEVSLYFDNSGVLQRD